MNKSQKIKYLYLSKIGIFFNLFRIGSEGVMRKWLYRNKFSINESDFTTIQRQTVDVKDILKVLKTNDTEEGLQKLF